MRYIIILLLCILATSKMSFQSAFGKKHVKSSVDALAFNGFVFAFSAALFAPSVFGCSPEVWMYASFSALFSVLFQFFYTKALTVGNVSLTVLIVNFSMVINVAVSYIFFDEPISFLRFCGILLTVLSFVVCTKVYGSNERRKSWLLLTVVSMLMSSSGSVVQKVFGESPYSGEASAFVSCLYIVAMVFAVLAYRVLSLKKGKKTFKTNFNTIKFAAAVGICLALFQVGNTYAISTIDGTFYFPAYTGGTVVFSTLSGVVIFKDKLTVRQVFGVLLGIVSVVLMNF